MSVVRDGEKEAAYVSSLSDYAQIFMFLRKFGALLSLPSVSLSGLAEFFLSGYLNVENEVVGVQWRLLTMVTRREGRKDWRKMATRFAFRSGIIDVVVPYPDIPVEKKVELMKLSCEGQFDCNLPFQAELKKLDLTSDAPTGTDSSGSRYWLLQDANYDVRLYKESGYDVLPPRPSSWSLLAKSIDELGVCVAKLASRAPSSFSSEGESENGEVEQVEVMDESGLIPEPECDSKGRAAKEPRGGRGGREGRGGRGGKGRAGEVPADEDGGCLVCRKDNDYQKMLLCDSCDNECHMYCLYPKLWTVPRGKWSCPECNERALVERLTVAHLELATARAQLEKATERKQRNVIRLQKSGLLLQNIILSNASNERTRRTRKVVNYAELNDVYLPPLGPKDFITAGGHPSGAESTDKSVQCVSTRASRRRRDLYGELEQYSVNSSEGRVDSHGRLPNSADVVDVVLPSLEDVKNQSKSQEETSLLGDVVDQHRHSSSGQPFSTEVVEPSQDSWLMSQQGNDNEDSHSLNVAVSEHVPVPDHKLPVWNGSRTDSGKVTPIAGEIDGIFKKPKSDGFPLAEL